MFDSERGRADITLCIFPHLREFIAIDVRPGRTGGPAVLSLSIASVLGEDFYSHVERDFSKIIRRHEMGFLELMGLPQQVEAVVRANSLKRILAELGKNDSANSDDLTGTVGVLFFAGSLLGLDGPQLHNAIQELFAEKLDPSAIEQLEEKLVDLMGRERRSVREALQQDIAGLISGESGTWVTLWESSGN